MVFAIAAAVAVALPALGAGPPRTKLASQTSAGEPANNGSVNPALSASGRFVAFYSFATNLPGNDLYAAVYVHDRRTGKLRLASRTSAGTPADGDSANPAISGSGRYVSFESGAENLPAGDDAHPHVYLFDRKRGKTRLVSKSSSGEPGDANSNASSVSASGRFVAFESSADNLPGDDAYSDVFVHDRKTGKTRLVSKTSSGTPADGASYYPKISASGRHVAFESNATNLPGDDLYDDVYVHDRKTGKTRLVSKSSSGAPGEGASDDPSMSASGRYVGFESNATNLPGVEAVTDAYLHDRKTGKTSVVSKNSAGELAETGGYTTSVSRSGRYVAFYSLATNLPGDDTYYDVYVRDRKRGKTRLASKTSAGAPADNDSLSPSIAASGRFVAFYSHADNLPGNPGVSDIYIHGPLP